jgi:RND family efflux transporter MFP subunit
MELFHPLRLVLIALLITIPARPATTGAEPAADRLCTAAMATHPVTLTGFTRARAEMPLVSQLTERLTEVKAEVGEPIGPEGVFARLDQTYAELDLKKILIEQDRQTSKIAYLEKEVQRLRTLFEKQAASEAKLDALQQDLAQAQLAHRSLQNGEQRAREHLRRHTITAPPGWLVSRRYSEPGEWVVAGAPLAEIGDYRTLLVPLAVSQDEYNRIKSRTTRLTLRLPEYSLTVAARLHRVSPGFDPQTRKLNLEIRISAAPPEQRGGIRAELDLELPDPAGALLAPTSAVSNRYDSSWLTRANGETVPVIVLGPGLRPDTLRISARKIKAGDQFRCTAD